MNPLSDISGSPDCKRPARGVEGRTTITFRCGRNLNSETVVVPRSHLALAAECLLWGLPVVPDKPREV